MQYLYYFANTSLVGRILTYLSKQQAFPLASVTVIYLVDRWVIRIKLAATLPNERRLNFQAFLHENGHSYMPCSSVTAALSGLDAGMSITDVMNKYQVVVVSHGALRPADVEEFRTTFVRGLGYCPPSLV